MLTLYGYPLSSAAYRVRIALALKGVKVSTVNKQLRRGEHRQKDDPCARSPAKPRLPSHARLRQRHVVELVMPPAGEHGQVGRHLGRFRLQK